LEYWNLFIAATATASFADNTDTFGVLKLKIFS